MISSIAIGLQGKGCETVFATIQLNRITIFQMDRKQQGCSIFWMSKVQVSGLLYLY